jgi:hypothetical protein
MFSSTKQMVVPNDVVSELSAIRKLTGCFRVPRLNGVRDLQVELKPPDVPPSNLQTRH